MSQILQNFQKIALWDPDFLLLSNWPFPIIQFSFLEKWLERFIALDKKIPTFQKLHTFQRHPRRFESSSNLFKPFLGPPAGVAREIFGNPKGLKGLKRIQTFQTFWGSQSLPGHPAAGGPLKRFEKVWKGLIPIWKGLKRFG